MSDVTSLSLSFSLSNPVQITTQSVGMSGGRFASSPSSIISLNRVFEVELINQFPQLKVNRKIFLETPLSLSYFSLSLSSSFFLHLPVHMICYRSFSSPIIQLISMCVCVCENWYQHLWSVLYPRLSTDNHRLYQSTAKKKRGREREKITKNTDLY